MHTIYIYCVLNVPLIKITNSILEEYTVKISHSLLCASIMLGAGTGNVIAKEHTGALAKSLSHAQHKNSSLNKGFNPPRTMSPQQFQELARAEQSLESIYKNNGHTVEKFRQTTDSPMSSVKVGCSTASDLSGLAGEDLVSAVKSGDLNNCLYGLFDTSRVGKDVFSDQSLLTIIGAINTSLNTYDATNSTQAAELEKLIIFLRAMHLAEWGNNRVFPAEYHTGLEQAFTSYFSSNAFDTYNGSATRNFMLRYEMLILVDSSGINRIPYIADMTDSLLGYANSVSRTNDWGVYYEENGVTRILTHLFNASSVQTAELEQEALNNPAIVNNLKQFVDTDGKWLVGHTREYQWSDSVNELARFLRFGGSIADSVRPSIQAVLSDYSHDGAGSQGWLNAQAAIGFYDSMNCNLYGDACSFDLEAVILSGNHTCPSGVKFRFQEPISSENLTNMCISLELKEQEFHQLLSTNSNSPVADDNNRHLEVVVFSSYNDYDRYAGTFFGISTDNGGMYLEGTPWEIDNQARFITHQATWLPGFQVWNLEHEYIHYLDGRYTIWGSPILQPVNTVWWAEGLAEYLSQPTNNPNALNVALDGTYQLSDIFQTTYDNGGTERVYYWTYLALRYMIEEQRSDVENFLLPTLRAKKQALPVGECTFDWRWELKTTAAENNWFWTQDDSTWASGVWVWTCGQQLEEDPVIPSFTPYQDILTKWGTNFDTDFNQWLACIFTSNGDCVAQDSSPADINGNNTVDIHDINLFRSMLRNPTDLSLDLDFNQDGRVNNRDLRPMMQLCDLPRCAIAQ